MNILLFLFLSIFTSHSFSQDQGSTLCDTNYACPNTPFLPMTCSYEEAFSQYQGTLYDTAGVCHNTLFFPMTCSYEEDDLYSVASQQRKAERDLLLTLSDKSDDDI